MAGGGTALEVKELEMRFGPVTALSGLSLAIDQGEIHGIVGHNGSGKSTFVEILAGSHVPSSGRMELFGKQVEFPGTTRLRESYPLVVVHQDVGLVGSMSVVDNFRVNRFRPGPVGTIRWRDEHRLTRERLKALGVEIEPKRLVEELSASDQVLLSVARALMDLEEIRERATDKSQSIMILDEPTSSLPSGTVDSFLETIRDVNRTLGTTVIIISHNPREIMALSHRFSALKNGTLVGTYPTGEVSYTELAALMAGQNEKDFELAGTVKRSGRGVSRNPKAPKMLSVSDLRGDRVKGVDFEVDSAEIVGITGLLGSGYEDIPYLLSGSQAKESGRVVFHDRELERINPRKFKDSGAILLPGDRQLTSGIQAATVRENMTMGHLEPFVRRGLLRHRSERQTVGKMMERMRIRPRNPDRPLNEFSGGQQQKSLIGRCLLRSAKLIVIDEPCTGIDVGARNEIHATLREIADSGSAVLITSCQYEELPMVCDRVIVLQNGQIAGELSGDEVTEEAILKLCYMDAETFAGWQPKADRSRGS
ncbi:MAG: sugar ABC transporter ATP-binding protein [Actinomycetota bacterium]|nr:sugar ABC transporter ATP-binding protein [Actinomycetota bacterium]